MAKRSSTAMPTPDAQVRVCVIAGPEEMLKRQLLEELKAALVAEYHEVDTLLFDGKTATVASVLDELRSYGLMQQHKIVIVDDADTFLTQHREAMVRYAQSPVDNGTLVFRSVKWNPGNLDKAIAKVGFVYKSEAMAPAAATAWVKSRCKEAYKRSIDPPAASLLVERLGTDLMRLDAEVSKLSLMVEPKGSITRDLVTQVVGKSSEEEAWEVQQAVLQSLTAGSSGPALQKIHELINLGDQPAILVAYFIADILRKLYLGKAMLRQGESEMGVGKAMKLWGPRQQAFMNVLRKVDEKRVGQLLDQIIELDIRSKSGRGDAARNVELFAATLGR